MSKIIFKTNLDAYYPSMFPKNLEHVPRLGEKVRVVESKLPYCESHKLPVVLEVVDVIHCEEEIVCELSYKEIDVLRLKAKNF